MLGPSGEHMCMDGGGMLKKYNVHSLSSVSQAAVGGL